MLVLSRKLAEAVVIDRDIRIVYLGTDRSQLKLGFESRTHHEIEREELIGAAPAVAIVVDSELQDRLRKLVTDIRRRPIPIADVIPLLLEAADQLDIARSRK